jgi:4'-phosphopantetheinyl transferase EntD
MSFFDDIQNKLARRSISFIAATEFRTASDLLPGERKAIRTACGSRQREFATGRWLARRLISEMGEESGEIKRGKNGEAIWPEGICGSITHTRGACCVITCFQGRYQSVGVDIESASRRISEPAREMFLNKDEIDWMSGRPAVSRRVCLAIFSIKESVYKTLFPLVKKPIPFSALSVRPLKNGGGFNCRVNVDLCETVRAGQLLHGWKFQNRNWFLTVAAL